MLCELHGLLGSNFLFTWALLSVLGLFSMLFFSGSVFAAYYWRPTFEQWQRKINPAFPPPSKVRDEILQTLKSLVVSTLCPAASLYLAQTGRVSKAYCGVDEAAGRGLAHQALCFFAIWITCDFFEFFYHYLGHRFKVLWEQHKSHHVFFNPSPFAVIADDAPDQFVRSSPLLFIPLLFPVNIDLLFGVFILFFYGYGTVLHWGFESSWLDSA